MPRRLLGRPFVGEERRRAESGEWGQSWFIRRNLQDKFDSRCEASVDCWITGERGSLVFSSQCALVTLQRLTAFEHGTRFDGGGLAC